MKVKRIKLINFQKHKELELSFHDGVNIIHGETDAGKSCVMRAFKFALRNEGKQKDIRKEGTKKTEVIIEYTNGLILTRIVSNSINRYMVNNNGNEDVYDNFGRNIPEEIQNLINMRPIEFDDITLTPNIADQISMPFLINESDTTKAKVLNHLTGSDISDKIVVDINKHIYGLQRKLKSSEELVLEQENVVSILKEKESGAKSKVDNISTLYSNLKDKIEEYKALFSIQNRLSDVNLKLNKVTGELDGVVFYDNTKLEAMDNKVVLINKYKGFVTSYNSLISKLKEVKEYIVNLHIFDIGNLEDKINIAKKLTSSNQRLKEIDIQADKYKQELKDTDNKRTVYLAKYKEYLKESKICPLCQSNIDDINLDNLKL